MLFGTDLSLEEKIIETLIKQNSITVHWLEKHLSRGAAKYSHQAIYKSLNKLLREGVLIKVGYVYSLKLTWILEFIRSAQILRRTHIESSALARNIEGLTKKAKVWKFSSPLLMDDFWAHILIALYHHSTEKIMYEWSPHAWYELVHRGKKGQFQEALRANNNQLYLIIGGDTYLDHYCTHDWPSDVYIYSCSAGPFEKVRSTYFNVIDDFVLTISFTKAYSNQIDALFDEVKSPKDVSYPQILRLFNSQTPIKVTLERNAQKARSFKKKFMEFFGKN